MGAGWAAVAGPVLVALYQFFSTFRRVSLRHFLWLTLYRDCHDAMVKFNFLSCCDEGEELSYASGRADRLCDIAIADGGHLAL